MLRRILPLLTALCMIFGMVPAAGFALEPAAPEGVYWLAIPTQGNPFDHGTGAARLWVPERADCAPLAEAGEYLTEAGAVPVVREHLKNRAETFTVYVKQPGITTDEEEIRGLVKNLFESALAHTGNPEEGDYLRWHRGAWNAGIEYGFSDDTMQLAITYTVEQYTTAEQEAELDRAVDSLLAELDLEDACDYEKICGIYDYIIHNVTYDHENLSNANHKLKFTAYAALVNKTAVCQGYALLFYRLALELGVDARLIPGSTTGDAEPDHAWNIVELNGRYYNLDATYDSDVGHPQWFLKGTGDFPDHTPDYDHVEEGFRTSYPMSSDNFEHTVTETVTKPTCTEEGYTTVTCTCGSSHVTDRVAASGHIWDEGVVTREPTETESGSCTYTCKVCRATRVESIPVEEHEHSYTAVVTAPTCTQKGCTTHTCACGDSYITDETPATGHTEVVDQAVAATCTADGKTEGSHCSVCNQVLVKQTVIPAPGHTEVEDKGVPATCTETGLTAGKHCSVCNQVLVKQTVTEPTGHSEEVDKAVAPTCTETGLTEGRHCSVCGAVLLAQETIAATGHTEVTDPAIPATCTESGLTEGKHCSVCEAVLVERKVIAALGHTEVIEEAVPATCTESGLTEGRYCSVCAEVFAEQQVVEATGHSWDDGVVTREPTETGTGIRTYTCANCGGTKTETIPELGHHHVHKGVVTEPTCTEGGYTTYTCSCGDSYVDDEVPALGHRYEDGACVVCGEKDPDATEPTVPSEPEETEPTVPSEPEETEPTVPSEPEETEPAVPSEPEETEPTVPSEPEETEPTVPSEPEETEPTAPSEPEEHTHKFGEWVSVKEPTGAAEGLEERRCDCGKAEQRVIPRLTNPFSDVKESNYFYESVLWAANKGITSGVSATQFAPNQPCTRAQVVTFLWRAAGEPEPVSGKNPFRDVNEAAYYYKAVLWAVEEGITSGMSATRFAPNQACTRAQVVTFLWRDKGEPEVKKTENTFTDVNAASYYYKAVLWAVEQGITTGMGNGRFAPDSHCTRGQIVTFLHRAFTKA